MVLAEYKKKREGKDDIKTVMNLVYFTLLNQTIPNSIISTKLNDLSNRSRFSSLWSLLYGTRWVGAKIEPKASRPNFNSQNGNNENGYMIWYR